MADTFTPNNNFDKPEVGASDNVWGGKLNANFDAMDPQVTGTIFGLTLSAAGSTATFGIAAGGASGMVLASAYTKTTGSWAVGSTNGALDTGTIANATWYHVWLIQRVDTGVVDVLVSTSVTSPTMPTNYTRKRLIGSMKTDGSAQWLKFVQLGDQFLWATPYAPGVATPTANTENLIVVGTPTGVQTTARLRGYWGANSTAGDAIIISSPDETNANAGPTSPHCTVRAVVSNVNVGFSIDIRTDTSGQVRANPTASGITLNMETYGFIHPRGKF